MSEPAPDHAHEPRAVRPLPRWALAVAVLALAGAGGAVLYFARAPAEVAKQPEPVKPAPPPKPTPKVDPERLAAEWALSKGARLVLTTDAPVNTVDKLPPLPGVKALLFERYARALEDVEQLRPFASLRELVCVQPPAFGGDGLAALLALPQAAEFTRLVVGSPTLTAKHVAGLTKCPKLYYLNLSNVPLAGKLGFLKELPALKHLFVGNTGISDADLAPLAQMPSLLSLTAFQNAGVTEKGIEPFANGPLTALDIARTGATGPTARVALKFPNLHSLSASGLSDADAVALCQLTKLQTVHAVDSPQLGTTGLAALAKLPALRVLEVRGSTIADADLDAFAPPANQWNALVFNNTRVTTPGAKRFLARYPKCDVQFDYDPKADRDRALAEWVIAKGGAVRVYGHLDPFSRDTAPLPVGVLRAYWLAFPLKGYSFRDDDLDRFRGTGANWFALAGPHALTDDGLQKWSAFPEAANAQCVQLTNRTVTATGYAHLAAFKKLIALHLPDSNVTDDALAVCKHLPKLRDLGLERTPVGDAGLKHLERSALESLAVPETKVGDTGAGSLATIPALKKLSLRGTQLTDTGLERMHVLTNLTELDVTNTRVTKAGVEALQKALPNCKVAANPAK
jgi:hypothetical protein